LASPAVAGKPPPTLARLRRHLPLRPRLACPFHGAALDGGSPDRGGDRAVSRIARRKLVRIAALGSSQWSNPPEHADRGSRFRAPTEPAARYLGRDLLRPCVAGIDVRLHAARID